MNELHCDHWLTTVLTILNTRWHQQQFASE